jgi:peptide-methionine (S)-S-oxide reductase
MRNMIGQFAFVLCTFTACGTAPLPATRDALAEPATLPEQNNVGTATAYFGAGCFWVEEAMFEDLKGVSHVVSGYAGGTVEKPSYEAVSSGETGHAETVQIQYDPQVISYPTLLQVFFGSQDPTQVDGQGPDEGSQYRSVVFYQNEAEKAAATTMMKELNATTYAGHIATELSPLTRFWAAEDYHQGYEKLHPDQPYVATVSKRRYDAFAAKFHDLLK